MPKWREFGAVPSGGIRFVKILLMRIGTRTILIYFIALSGSEKMRLTKSRRCTLLDAVRGITVSCHKCLSYALILVLVFGLFDKNMNMRRRVLNAEVGEKNLSMVVRRHCHFGAVDNGTCTMRYACALHTHI